MLQKFLLSKRGATKDLNRVIYGLPPKEKKDLIEGLVEGDIEIGDGIGDGEKWQIVKMQLACKAEAVEQLMGESQRLGDTHAFVMRSPARG